MVKQSINYTSSLLTLFFVVLLGSYVVAHLLPRDAFFAYHSIKPEYPVFDLDEEITFVSHYNIHIPVEMSWLDVLICDYDNDGRGFKRVRQFESSYPGRRGAGEYKSTWTYRAAPLPKPATCYLQSKVEGEWFGAHKFQTVISPHFRVE